MLSPLMIRRQPPKSLATRTAFHLAAGCFLLVAAATAEPFTLLTKALTADPQDMLTEASGVALWTDAMTSSVSGLPAVKCADGKIGGALQAGQPASFGYAWPNPGADLDFGFRDFVDLELRLPNGFKGSVALDFAAEGHQADQALDRILLPMRVLKADGQSHRYRVDVGLVPRWRGLLTRLALVIEPAAGQGGGTVAVGRLQVGDRPGDTVAINLKLNLKPGMKIEGLKKVESKHGCTWWEPAHEKNGFDPVVMPRRALRMLEETWQIAVNQLGYRDPCLGENPASTTRHKINHITWYDGFWMGGGDPPHLNIQAGGLHDESWGNPMPHELVHTVQAGQLDFLNGCHWESHANYVRFCRNFHFREFTGLDCLDFGVLLRSNYFQDHPRLIYADYRPYFYLDNDPDQFGFAPGLTAKLWQTGTKDERLWTRLPKLLPPGVTLAQVAAGMARSWITFDFPAGEHIKTKLFGPDQDGRIRWFRYMAPLTPVADRPEWWAAPLAKAPMKFGWCCHEIEATAPVINAKLEGLDIQGADEDWRWGFVSLGAKDSYVVSDIFKPGTGSFKVPAGNERLILFVAATPKNPSLSYPRPTPDTAVDRHPEHRRYPYEITFRGAKPKDLRLPVDMPDGKPHPNGGGFVANSAKVDASAFVGPDARVLGTASVLGQARILDRAVIRETATVRDRAEVSGAAVVGGNAKVSDDARVRNFAFVGGQAKLRERARVGDLAEVQENLDIAGDAWLRGVTAPLGNSKIGGYAILDADYAMAFDLNDGVHFHHVPWGEWYLTEFAAKLTKPRGLVASYHFNETDGAQALDEFGALVATVRGNPARKDGALQLNAKGQYLVLDSSLIDAPAATWLIEARLLDDKVQALLAINDATTAGVLLGISNQGLLTAALASDGKPPVVLASKTRVPTGVPVTLGLRLDGKTAALVLNGEVAAERAWKIPPQAMFRDATQAAPTAMYLGRDAKGNGCRADLLGFRAFNVALTTAELAETRAAMP
jgi:hypothetical protein